MSEKKSPPTQPSQSAIHDALQRVLAHAPFERSPVLCRFLTHVVEHALKSATAPLKEYTLGLEVFDRAEDFDPRVDTIVRVQARRLRDALAAYYKHDGKHDPLRLEMPKGHYAIRARFANDLDQAAPPDDSARTESNAVFTSAPLPVARTPLIGRESELELLTSILKDKATRLLTISGVGGTGKTRLAFAAANATRDAFPGGVLFLDLSAVNERNVLVHLLADVFNVRRTEGRVLLETIAERIRNKLVRPTLLVLDNMEGVLTGTDVLGEMLDANVLLNVLVTSRVALRLYGENEFPLAPLAIPVAAQRHDQASLAAVPSVQLFLARAAAANPHADFSTDIEALAELCVRLDGLPLAIELVAAQAGAMSVAQMLQRFTGHLDLPENPARDAPSRQRTLRRVIDWSYDLLDERSRAALRRLAVFAGGFTLEAAEAVADAGGDLGAELLPGINTLVEMGLVYFRGEQHEPRFAMLETLRAYGLERLNASGEGNAVRKAHAAYCVVLAEEGVGTLTPEQREGWLARCDQERANFRQALQYLLRHGPQRWALRLGHALFLYWERREKFFEGRSALDAITQTVPVETDTALWAKVMSYAATVAAFQADVVASDAGFARVLELYRQLGDHRGEASALNALGVNARLRGDESAARGWLVDALQACRQIGDSREVAAALSNLAECDLELGQTDGVYDLLSEANDLFVADDDLRSAAWGINHMGDLARKQGDYAKAADCYQSAEAEFRRLGDAWGLARSLADRGQLAIDRGDVAAAGPLLLDALVGFETLHHKRGMATVADSMARLAWAAHRPECVIKLLAAAESWRSALGYTGRRKDLALAERLREQVRPKLDSATLNTMHDEGLRMSAADVAACIQAMIAN